MSERKIYGGTRRHSFFDRSSNPGETLNINEILSPVTEEDFLLLNDADDEFAVERKALYDIIKNEGFDGLIKAKAEMTTFTLDDVRKLIRKMERKNIIKPKDYIVNIPFIGRKLYQKACAEEIKINVLKEQLEKAENGSELDRQRFIDDLEPLLAKGSSKLKTVINSKQDK